MPNTIVYYDETGKIIMTESGNYLKPAGAVSYLETTIPDGYIPASVGENGEVITEALPKSAEQQRLDALEQQMDALIGAETEV